MTKKNLAIKALRQLARALPDGSNIEVRIRNGSDCSYICHKFSVAEGLACHSESHSDDFIESSGGRLLTGKAKIRWPS